MVSAFMWRKKKPKLVFKDLLEVLKPWSNEYKKSSYILTAIRRGEHRGLLETKNRRKPQNSKKLRPKAKPEIKTLTNQGYGSLQNLSLFNFLYV